jgi:hypothetical protein
VGKREEGVFSCFLETRNYLFLKASFPENYMVE